MSWRLIYTNQAHKDAKNISSDGLKKKAAEILSILKDDPFRKPPPFEKLIGDLKGAYSRRVNIQHRIVYQVLRKKKIIKVIRMWTHYE